MALINEFRKQGDFLFKNRSYFPLLIIVVAIIVDAYIYYYHLSNPYGPTENYYQFIAVVLCLFGLYIRIFTVGFSPDGTSGRNTKEGQVASELNTTGAYSMLRHPLYLGNFFMWFGVAFWVKDFWFIIAFIFLYTLYYERIMYAEEAFLIQKFNNQYTTWSSKTPAIIPSFKNYQRPQHPFSFLKVLKKEKNGLFAIFLLFWIFDEVQVMSYEHRLVFVKDLWFWLCLVTGMVYIILKILKKKGLLSTNKPATNLEN